MNGKTNNNGKSKGLPQRAPKVKPRATMAPKKSPLNPTRSQSSVAAAYATGQHSGDPKYLNYSKDGCRIVHRELIASVTGTVAFTVANSFALNPGQATSFPWLAGQAQGWERYRFNKLRFCYYTRTGSNVPGSVLLAPDFDASDVAPSTEQIASTYKDSEEDAPWKDIKCELSPSALHAIGPTKFVRTGSLSADQDIKLYDSGNLFLCTVDGTAVSWGKLWVEYDVSFFTPQLNPLGSGSYQRVSGVTPTSTSLLGTQTLSPTSTESLFTVSNQILTFTKAGTFLVTADQVFTSGLSMNTPVLGAGAVVVGHGISFTTSATKSSAIVQCTAIVGSTITFDSNGTGGLTAQVVCSQLPSGAA
jgi:hypothetical protein